MSLAEEHRARHPRERHPQVTQDETAAAGGEARDIAEVPAVELINTVAVHLLSAAAVKVGLADDRRSRPTSTRRRKLITALAGLVTAAATEIGDHHARPLRDGLRSVQLAFREAVEHPGRAGQGAGREVHGPRQLTTTVVVTK